jgi:predicted O-linked N-acetylglucosamine transferase (SPINDLY family)
MKLINSLIMNYIYNIYITIGRHDGALSAASNTEDDDSPALPINIPSQMQLSQLATEIEVEEEHITVELNSLANDGLEHLAGYICNKLNNKNLISNIENATSWTNHLSEGGLKNPSQEMMNILKKLENIFVSVNGDTIFITTNFLNLLIQKAENIDCDLKVKQLIFRSRMFFRLRTLNQVLKTEQSNKKRKFNKILN